MPRTVITPGSRWWPVALLLALLSCSADCAALASSSSLDALVQRAASQLQRGWRLDPLTASLPFPGVRLLAAGRAADSLCAAADIDNRPARTGFYCRSLDAVLLERDLLQPQVAARGDWSVSYWLGIALAERIQQGQAVLEPAPTANLQANCLAGVMLSLSGMPRPADSRTLLAPALLAYGASGAASRGTAGMRGYALLTGFGATAADCSAGRMAALAMGQVAESDRALFSQIGSAVRGHASLLAAISSQCKPRPKRPCPPTLRQALATQGRAAS